MENLFEIPEIKIDTIQQEDENTKTRKEIAHYVQEEIFTG
jgi:hypothetical protein